MCLAGRDFHNHEGIDSKISDYWPHVAFKMSSDPTTSLSMQTLHGSELRFKSGVAVECHLLTGRSLRASWGHKSINGKAQTSNYGTRCEFRALNTRERAGDDDARIRARWERLDLKFNCHERRGTRLGAELYGARGSIGERLLAFGRRSSSRTRRTRPP